MRHRAPVATGVLWKLFPRLGLRMLCLSVAGDVASSCAQAEAGSPRAPRVTRATAPVPRACEPQDRVRAVRERRGGLRARGRVRGLRNLGPQGESPASACSEPLRSCLPWCAHRQCATYGEAVAWLDLTYHRAAAGMPRGRRRVPRACAARHPCVVHVGGNGRPRHRCADATCARTGRPAEGAPSPARRPQAWPAPQQRCVVAARGRGASGRCPRRCARCRPGAPWWCRHRRWRRRHCPPSAHLAVTLPARPRRMRRGREGARRRDQVAASARHDMVMPEIFRSRAERWT